MERSRFTCIKSRDALERHTVGIAAYVGQNPRINPMRLNITPMRLII